MINLIVYLNSIKYFENIKDHQIKKNNFQFNTGLKNYYLLF